MIAYTNFSGYFTSPPMLHHSLPRNHPFIIFYVHIVFAYTSASPCIFKILPSVYSVRSSAGNFYASHVSYLEHNSSQLEVSWAKKGAWEKIKTSHDWTKVIFSLFLSHLLISLILKNLNLQVLVMIIKIMRKISHHVYAFSFLTFTNSEKKKNSICEHESTSQVQTECCVEIYLPWIPVHWQKDS